jgi:hypothetical protein
MRSRRLVGEGDLEISLARLLIRMWKELRVRGSIQAPVGSLVGRGSLSRYRGVAGVMVKEGVIAIERTTGDTATTEDTEIEAEIEKVIDVVDVMLMSDVVDATWKSAPKSEDEAAVLRGRKEGLEVVVKSVTVDEDMTMNHRMSVIGGVLSRGLDAADHLVQGSVSETERDAEMDAEMRLESVDDDSLIFMRCIGAGNGVCDGQILQEDSGLRQRSFDGLGVIPVLLYCTSLITILILLLDYQKQYLSINVFFLKSFDG